MKEESAVTSTACPPSACENGSLHFKHIVERGDNFASGSHSFDDPDRPRWDSTTTLEAEFDYHRADGTYSHTVLKGRRADGEKVFLNGRSVPGGFSELDIARKDGRKFYSYPGLTMYEIGAGDNPAALYREPELIADMAARPDDPVFICEGEKDANTLRSRGLIATTNANGADQWPSAENARFKGRDVVVMVDNDPKGRDRARQMLPGLRQHACTAKAIELPRLRHRGDVTDWLNGANTVDDLLRIVAETDALSLPGDNDWGVRCEDFYAFMPAHNYIFAPSGESWPSTSVNSHIPTVPLFDGGGDPVLDDDGEQVRLKANIWLDQNRPVEQMTWAPGEPQVIPDRLISDGGWIHHPGCNVFNLYRPPTAHRGDPKRAERWLEHVRCVYPNEAEHIINWLAHRVQRPQEKINHALVMGGAMGVGKDTILEPVKAAVGPWNFAEVSPQHMLGRFNGFVKSVILRVSEARDLGDVDRFAFYDHMKSYTAAPPDVLRVDEKNRQEYAVFNVCGVIITTNHKTNGIFLPPDDRRHFVAWTELSKEDFAPGYWDNLWGWYAKGGTAHVAAYLASKDISGFQAKAPPPKTEAFWDVVASNSAPEDAELSDALEKLGWPEATTLKAIGQAAESSFADWLRDRKNSRSIPHKMEECGYRSVRNPNSKQGRWKVNGRDVAIYVRKQLSVRDAIAAADKRAKEGDRVPM